MVLKESLNQAHGSELLMVDTSLIEPFSLTPGTTVLLIGEVHDGANLDNKFKFFLRPRVCSKVSELDIDLYTRALKLRRQFLGE